METTAPRPCLSPVADKPIIAALDQLDPALTTQRLAALVGCSPYLVLIWRSLGAGSD